MDKILPRKVLEQIQVHYVAAIAEAQIDYSRIKPDEESLTESLGQAFLDLEQVVETDDHRTYYLISGYRRIERRHIPPASKGALGIFQIELSDGVGRVLWRHGLLFTGTREWTGKDAKLLCQAQKLNGNFRRAIIIDYSADGYKAASAAHVIAADANRKRMRNRIRKLSDMLAIEFLHGRMGVMNLYWDADNAVLHDPDNRSTSLYVDHVFSIHVRRE